MKKLLCILLSLVLLCAFALADDGQSTADAIMAQLASGEYQALWDQMTPVMQGAITPAQLAATVQQLGAVSSCEALNEQTVQDYRVYTYRVKQAGSYQYTLSLDAEGKLAGLFIEPLPELPQPSENHVSETLLLREGQADETHAMLTLPVSDGPFPAVILIQGSGPSDMNESVLGLAPLLDLAEGLADCGIASIRYDKYTYAHPELCMDADFTVATEYILDARDALAVLEADPRINGIFLVGHSQSGMLMPRIISELGAEHFLGGVSLSGSPLHLWEIIYQQNLDVLATMGEAAAYYRPIIEAEADLARSLATAAADALPADTVFSLPVWYMWDECQVDASACVEANGLPILCIQGEYDWQVNMENGLEAWQRLCPQAACVVIPAATHVLTQIDTPTGTQADYVAGSHVCDEALDVLSSWILAQVAD